MNLRSFAALSFVGLFCFALGCSSGGGGGKQSGNLCKAPPAAPEECGGATTKFYVLSTLKVTQAVDGVSRGFNLDCRTDASCKCATMRDENGKTVSKCGDLTSPTGEKGIDNQFSAITTQLASFGENFDIDGLIGKNILEGDLILLVQISELDADTVTATTNDECVNVEVYLGFIPDGGAPLVASGVIAEGQTFDLDQRSFTDGDPMVRFPGTIENGVLNAGPANIPFSFPVGAVIIDLLIQDGHLQAKLDGSTLKEGLISGVLDVDDVVASIAAVPDYEALSGTIESVLANYADMNGEGDKNQCSAVSASLDFNGLGAVRGQIREKPPKDDGGDDAGDDAGTDAN